MPESGVEAARLDRECAAFTAYFVGQEPGPYVLEKYRDAHARAAPLRGGSAGAFDRLLVRLAVLHPVATALVDAYTAVFFRRARLREKWVLLLALLETAPHTGWRFDVPDGGGRTRLALALTGRVLRFAGAVALSALPLLPLQMLLGAGRRRLRAGERP